MKTAINKFREYFKQRANRCEDIKNLQEEIENLRVITATSFVKIELDFDEKLKKQKLAYDKKFKALEKTKREKINGQ